MLDEEQAVHQEAVQEAQERMGESIEAGEEDHPADAGDDHHENVVDHLECIGLYWRFSILVLFVPDPLLGWCFRFRPDGLCGFSLSKHDVCDHAPRLPQPETDAHPPFLTVFPRRRRRTIPPNNDVPPSSASENKLFFDPRQTSVPDG